MSTVKIDKIKLSIAGQDIEMTLEQAKELRAVLNDLWPQPEEKLVPSPAFPITQPAVIERWPEIHWWELPTTICESGCNTVVLTAK